MKTARFLFTLAGFGALALGASFAGETSPQASGPAPAAGPAANSPAAPGQQSVGHTQTKRAPAGDLHQPAPNKPVTAAKDGAMMNTAEKQRSRPTLSPPPSRFIALPVHPAPGRGAAPASLGGLAAASAKKSAAAINGAEIKPKP